MAVGAAAYFGLQKTKTPIAEVNGNVITREDFNKDYQAVYNYYYAAARTYGDAKQFNAKENANELKKATLGQLIENVLVHDEVGRRFGDATDEMVARKVDAAAKDKDFERAATAIYGLAFSEFRSRFLVPLAESELLDGQLIAEKSSVSEWLTKAKQEAKVTILDSAFTWGENGVELK